MAILLIHKAMDGEPLGIWNEDGESYYTPGYEEAEDDGRDTIETKGWAIPWYAFAERVSRGVNFQEWWSTVVTDDPLEDALEQARITYFSHQSARTPRDR